MLKTIIQKTFLLFYFCGFFSLFIKIWYYTSETRVVGESWENLSYWQHKVILFHIFRYYSEWSWHQEMIAVVLDILLYAIWQEKISKYILQRWKPYLITKLRLQLFFAEGWFNIFPPYLQQHNNTLLYVTYVFLSFKYYLASFEYFIIYHLTPINLQNNLTPSWRRYLFSFQRYNYGKHISN